jgi:quinol monooxygenase YgiN
MAATLFVKHKVSDYESWKKVYDGLGPVRRDVYGILNASVHRDINDPNTVVVTHRFADAKAATDFAGSPELKAAMASAGVISQPEVGFAEDIEETSY